MPRVLPLVGVGGQREGGEGAAVLPLAPWCLQPRPGTERSGARLGPAEQQQPRREGRCMRGWSRRCPQQQEEQGARPASRRRAMRPAAAF